MRKLAAAGLSYAAAIFLACYFIPGKFQLWAAIFSLLAALPAIFMTGKARLRLVLISAGLAVGFLWNAGYNSIVLNPARSLAGTERVIEGRVLDFSEHYESGNSVFLIRITSDGIPALKVKCRYWDADAPNLEPGDIITAEVEFSEVAYLDEYLYKGYSSDSYLLGTLKSKPELSGRSRIASIYSPLYLARAINNKVFELWPGDVSHFMIALLTGNKTLLYEDSALVSAMARSGLLHVVAVSGTHVSFLVGSVSLIFKKRKHVLALCVPIFVVFTVMTGMSPSVIRAAIMQLFVLAASQMDGEADSITSFSAILALILLINPTAGYDIGLQLSFASVLSIILFSGRIYEAIIKRSDSKEIMKKKLIDKAVKGLAAGLSASLGALVFAIPLTAIYFGYVPMYSLIANMLTLWMVSILFTVGFPLCAVGALFPPVGVALGSVSAWGVRYIIFVVKFISAIPFSALYTSYNLAAWWIVFAYVVFVVFYVLKRKEGFRPALPLCLSASILLVVLFLSTLQPSRVTAIDVGRGQSIALLTETGVVVVDCGSLSGEDAGICTADYLFSRNRRRVDLLVLTHLHADHANGAAALMELVDVKLVVMPMDDEDSDGILANILDAAQKTGTQVAFLESDAGYTLGSLGLELIAPIGSQSINERGIIVLGGIGEFDFLITGDVDAITERRLLLRRELPQIELLVAGHHGSRYSTSEELLLETKPMVSFISVGKNN